MMPDIEQKAFFRSAERKVFSQFCEDGIIQAIFDRIGATDRKFVEFGIGNGKECITANLSINHGWSGLLMEGNAKDVERARAFYGAQPAISAGAVDVRNAFITVANINDLLEQAGIAGPIDLFSLDIDGNDYWVWQAITAIDPRVVVIEYNAAFGDNQSLTVTYDPSFERFAKHPSGLYHGASLAALAGLGERKGYQLVCGESSGVNAFFVKRELAAEAEFTAVRPCDAYYEHAWRKAKYSSTAAQWELIRDLPYERVPAPALPA